MTLAFVTDSVIIAELATKFSGLPWSHVKHDGALLAKCRKALSEVPPRMRASGYGALDEIVSIALPSIRPGG